MSTDSDDPSGEKENTVESYSMDVPGSTRDAKLHLVQPLTTKQNATSDGRQTSIQQVEQPYPGGGLRVITIGTEDTRSGPSGTESTRTVQVRHEWQL